MRRDDAFDFYASPVGRGGFARDEINALVALLHAVRFVLIHRRGLGYHALRPGRRELQYARSRDGSHGRRGDAFPDQRTPAGIEIIILLFHGILHSGWRAAECRPVRDGGFNNANPASQWGELTAGSLYIQ